MKKSVFVLGLVLSQSLLAAENRQKDRLEMPGLFAKIASIVSQSQAVCWYSQHIAVKMRPSFGTELASAKYQSLGQEAQAVVGVPQGRILSVKKLSCSNSLLAELLADDAVAIIEPDAIYINEEELNERPFGSQRATLFHGSCYVKYNDVATGELVGWAARLLGGGLAYKAIKAFKLAGKYKFLHGLGVIAASLTADCLVSIIYGKFAERRADLEAHYALQCATCVKESATAVQKKLIKANNSLIGNGYLSPSELGLIADDLERQNKKCVYHGLDSGNIVTEK